MVLSMQIDFQIYFFSMMVCKKYDELPVEKVGSESIEIFQQKKKKRVPKNRLFRCIGPG